ncbi:MULTISPECIES: DUF1801 domain-containing protein [Hyphomicrobiales]|jgi:hypothetical protein|uniref:DUF1801 domain-containing protein n=1 Tax=Hyphomicrobiales TaxID=356 RepID=UPI0003AB33E6|nr:MULTISPECIES: DUF1801 domain-containing protein [Phyllobacteriaceae]MCX8569994.1 DUF1801 domain-containing protein [Aminobacter sp. MET-1]
MHEVAKAPAPPAPKPILEALSRHPETVRTRLLDIRDLIFEVAAETEGVGTLTETLKWGEPAYLTQASGSGSTVRLGATRSLPGRCAVFFNCNTTLVETFRSHLGGELEFEGNRAVIVPADAAIPEAALAFCLRAALTYHQRKGAGLRP